MVLAGAVVAAVAARLAYAFWGIGPRLTDDETSFWAIATNLAHGRGFSYLGTPTAWRPPGYVLLLAGLRELGLGIRGVQGVQALLGGALPLLFFGAARRLRIPIWTALGAAWAGALYPPFVHFSSQALSENLAIPLLVLGVWATLVALDRPRWSAGLLCGAAWGLAILARPAALAAFVVGVVVIALARPLGRRLVIAGSVVLAAFLVLAPWTLRNAHALGGFVPVTSSEGFTLWAANRPDAKDLKHVYSDSDPLYPGSETYATYGRFFPGIEARAASEGFDFASAPEAARDEWFRSLMVKDVRAAPGRFLRRAVLKTVAILSPAPSRVSREELTPGVSKTVLWFTSGPLVVLGLCGLGGLALRGRRCGKFLFAAAVVPLVVLAAHLPYVRFRVGAVDPILILASVWLIAVVSRRAGWSE
ncbi:MAG: glycosyltransferase family 39 protein [Actinomycetota bacterium]